MIGRSTALRLGIECGRRASRLSSLESRGSRPEIRSAEVVAFEQQGYAAYFRESVGEQIAKVQIRWMATSLSISHEGSIGRLQLGSARRHDLEYREP